MKRGTKEKEDNDYIMLHTRAHRVVPELPSGYFKGEPIFFFFPVVN